MEDSMNNFYPLSIYRRGKSANSVEEQTGWIDGNENRINS
jgi:hypothetical protein